MMGDSCYPEMGYQEDREKIRENPDIWDSWKGTFIKASRAK